MKRVVQCAEEPLRCKWQNEWKFQSSAWSIQAYPSLVRASLVISRPSVCRAHFSDLGDVFCMEKWHVAFRLYIKISPNVAPATKCAAVLSASTLIYASLLFCFSSFFELLRSQLHHPQLLFSSTCALLWATLLCPTLFHFILLYSPLPYFILFDCTLLTVILC